MTEENEILGLNWRQKTYQLLKREQQNELKRHKICKQVSLKQFSAILEIGTKSDRVLARERSEDRMP